MSLPTQNARPLPVRTTARTSGSSLTWVTWLISAAVIDGVNAFSLAGRSMVSTATWSRMSSRTWPGSEGMVSCSFRIVLPGHRRGRLAQPVRVPLADQVRAGPLDDLAHRGLRLAVVAALDGLRHPLMGGQRLTVMRDPMRVQRP